MSTSTELPYENIDSGFLKNPDDVTVFVSVICGVLGLFLVLGFIGFISEQLGFLETKSETKTSNLNNLLFKRDPEDGTCNNHYPPWFYDKLASIEARKMEENTTRDDKAEDPVSFVNQVFSDILDESFENKREPKSIAYDGNKKMIKPERKPSVSVAYGRAEPNTSKEKTESSKEKVKISLKNEKIEEKAEELKTARAILVENYNSPQDTLNFEEEDKTEGRIIAISAKEFSTDVKPKIIKQQTVEYENPEIIKKLREQKRKEDEERERLKKENENKKKRRILLEKSPSLEEVVKKEPTSPKKKKVISDKRDSAPYTDANTLPDSFLY